MSSQEVDYDALAATTTIEEITENRFNRDTLRLLRDNDASLSHLCLGGCVEDPGDYDPGSSEELGWLGHFAKKSTRLESFGIYGDEFFDSCGKQSVERFFEDLDKCNHIKKMNFTRTDLDGIIYKLGNIKSNNITHWFMEGCYLGVPEATFLFNTFRDMNSLEELVISDGYGGQGFNDFDDGVMAGCIPSLAPHSAMRRLTLENMSMSTNSSAALNAVLPRMAGLLDLHLRDNSIDNGCVEVLVRGLANCKYLDGLHLGSNRIGDDGLDVLIRGLPASVNILDLAWNEVSTATVIQIHKTFSGGQCDLFRWHASYC